MNKILSLGCIASLLLAAFLPAAAGADDAESTLSVDPSGVLQTINASRNNPKGAFFQSLGTNGRSCSTCHVMDQAMSISPPQIRQRFERSHGRDPLFAAFDGANCTNGKPSHAPAHSLLWSHALILIELPPPAIPPIPC